MIKSDRINFRLGPDLRSVLQRYTTRHDRSEAETIREALWIFLESKGYGRRAIKKGKKKRVLLTREGREIELEREYGVCMACGLGIFPPG